MTALLDALRPAEIAIANVEALVAGRSTPAAPRVRAAAVRERIASFLRVVRWRVVVPGQHRSGLSNQELFEVRAREGRDFLVDTVQLKQHARRELFYAFAGFPRVPSLDELRREHARIVKHFIATERFDKRGGDLLLTPLTPEYARRKIAAGKGQRPIGVWSGRHLAALRRGTLEYQR